MENNDKKRIKLNILGIKLSVRNPFALQNNKIILIKNGHEKIIKKIRGLKVKFYGSDAKIIFFDEIPTFKNSFFECFDNCEIAINKTTRGIRGLTISARGKNNKVSIGKNFSIVSGKFDFHGESNTEISIGDDCLFGGHIELDTADGHTIFNPTSKEVLNKPQSIKINNHVWICERVSILKGAEIPQNCVVAKNATVTKKFIEENTILGGIPAKILSSQINWNINSTEDFSKENSKNQTQFHS